MAEFDDDGLTAEERDLLFGSGAQVAAQGPTDADGLTEDERALLGLADDTPSNGQQAPAPISSQLWGDEAVNATLGGLNGMLLGNADNLANLGGGDALMSLTDWGRPPDTRSDAAQPPTFEGTPDNDYSALYELAEGTPEGALARGVGQAGMGAALAALAPQTLLAQTGTGAATGGLAAGGAGDWENPVGIGLGTLGGGALGALGHGAGRVLDWLRGPAPAALGGGAAPSYPAAREALDVLASGGRGQLPRGNPVPGGAAAMGRGAESIAAEGAGDLAIPAAEALSSGVGRGYTSIGTQPRGELANVSVPGATGYLAKHAGRLAAALGMRTPTPAAQAVLGMGAPGGAGLADLFTSKAHAQPLLATGYTETTAPWSESELVTGGATPQEPGPTGGYAMEIRPEAWTETPLRRPMAEIGEAQMLPPMRPSIGEAQPLGPWEAEIGEAQMAPGVDIGDAEIKAFAGMPALDYSVRTVLSGDSGLPDEAKAQLTQAIATNDPDKLKTMSFKFQQRFPEYQRRLKAQLDALNAQE